MSSYHAKKGFSLIELMTAIVIIGIMIGFAAPNFARYNKNRQLEAAARRIVSDMRLVRSIAIGQHHRVRIEFSETNFLYTVFVDRNDDNTFASDEVEKTVDLLNSYPAVRFARLTDITRLDRPVPHPNTEAVSFGIDGDDDWTGFRFSGGALPTASAGFQSGCLFLTFVDHETNPNSYQQIAITIVGTGTIKAYRYGGNDRWLDFI